MNRFLIFLTIALLFAVKAAAQTPEKTFRIDSIAPAVWYWVEGQKWVRSDSTMFYAEEGRLFRSKKALVGSSRVDLQACKLEYSIVSPK